MKDTLYYYILIQFQKDIIHQKCKNVPLWVSDLCSILEIKFIYFHKPRQFFFFGGCFKNSNRLYHIFVYQDQAEVKEGGFAHFEARLEPMGDHTMKVEWFKDGRPVEASSRKIKHSKI